MERSQTKKHSEPAVDPGTGRLPDFLIIGAAKSGTTTLYQYLRRHPKVYLPKLKEPEFFSHASVFARGLNWYKKLFAAARPEQICGEASTRYSRWPHTLDAAKNIAEVLPQAKLIYLAREPIDRTYSHYEHLMRDGVSMTFEEALERTDILDTSLYMKQVERFLRFFPPESVHFVLFEELRRNPDAVLRGVQKFLDVEARDLIAGGQILANVGRADFYIRQRTTQPLRTIPGMSPLISRMPQRWKDEVHRRIKRSALGKTLRRRYDKRLALRPETRQKLASLFARPNQELAAFLGRDLHEWEI